MTALLAVRPLAFCNEADAEIHGELTLAASCNTLPPTLAFDEPDVDVSVN